MFYVDVIYKGGVFCMWLKRKMENIAYLNSEKENVNILLKEKKKIRHNALCYVHKIIISV